MTVCALCKEERHLRNSHVIPEFMYKQLYDEKHKFWVLSASEPSWEEQKGLREHLLCGECETKLSKWETYTSRLLSNGVPTVAKRTGDLIWVDGADYEKFKLFQLSILWRAGASNLPMFSKVQLGVHEETIRQRVFSETPGAPSEYGCALYALTTKDGVDRGLIVAPTLCRMEAIHTYHFVFGGLIWLFFVSNHSPSRHLTEGFVQRNGRFAFLAPESMGPKYVEKLAAGFHRSRQEARDAL